MKISGVKVEGVLRQSADVDDVDQRIRDYEQGTSSKYPSMTIIISVTKFHTMLLFIAKGIS